MNALRACAALTFLATLSACGDALAPLPAQARIEFAEVGERAGLTLVHAPSGDEWQVVHCEGDYLSGVADLLRGGSRL